ncbi:MAG: polysaccharide pyruvyl transferase CsaB [Candidatus Bipolaricaulia bacterium]
MAERVLIGGYYGFGNLGDEALLFSLLRNLKRCLPDVEPVILSGAPRRTAAEHGVEALNRWNLLRVWQELGQAGLFLLGGGGLLQDVTSRRSALYYLWLIRLAQLRGVPVLLLGQGIGPLQSHLLQRMLVKRLKRADYVMVRDERSLELLREWGADHGQLAQGYDLALSLEPEEPVEQRDLLAVSLREVRGRERERFIAAVAGALDEAHRRIGLRAAFIPLHPREDLRLAEEVRRAMAEESLLLDLTGMRIPEALQLLSQTKLMLGGRLHALEFSLVCRVPFIGLSYDPKVDRFAHLAREEAGVEPPLLKVTEITKEKLLAALEELWENREEYRERLGAAALRLRELADSALEEACARMARVMERRGGRRKR